MKGQKWSLYRSDLRLEPKGSKAQVQQEIVLDLENRQKDHDALRTRS